MGKKKQQILSPEDRADRRALIEKMWNDGNNFAEIRRETEAIYGRSCNYELLCRVTGYQGGLGRGVPIAKHEVERHARQQKRQSAAYQPAPMVIEAAKDHETALAGAVRTLRQLMLSEGIERIEVTQTTAKAHRTETLGF